MEEKITIGITRNKCLDPKTHSVGALLVNPDGEASVCYPYHREDQLGNFNEAARLGFDEYLKDKDLTPKSKNLYSGKILLVDTKHYGTGRGYKIVNVKNGLFENIYTFMSGKNDLRIENDMNSSQLFDRIISMYFDGRASFCVYDKAMYFYD